MCGSAHNVVRGLFRSIFVSSFAGWKGKSKITPIAKKRRKQRNNTGKSRRGETRMTEQK
jgi:hypothetical protein